MTPNNQAEEINPTASDEPGIRSVVTAHFSTYEDLSSRLVLLPFNDEECIGAKVCSHEVSGECISNTNATVDDKIETCTNNSSDVESIEEKIDVGAHDRYITANTDHVGEPTEMDEPAEATDRTISVTAENTAGAGKKRKKNKKKRKKKQSNEASSPIDGDGSQDVSEANESSESPQVSTDTVEGGAALAAIEDAVDATDNHKSNMTADDIDNSKSSQESQSLTLNAPKIVGRTDEAVPVGHVLIKLTGKIACMEHSVEHLEERDFTEILSLLRDVAYPIMLTFDSPESLSKGNINDGSASTNSHVEAASDQTNIALNSAPKDELDASSSKDDDEYNNHSIAVSREEAAKYAAQAASELRGRLTRWGFQAAAKASEAAQAVQELREERQRRVAEEQEKVDVCEEKKCDEAAPTDSEKETDESPNDMNKTITSVDADDVKTEDTSSCRLFLQTASGFVQLDQDSTMEQIASPSSHLFSSQKKSTLVTNMSVITVRMSEEKACPVGKNTFKFQWYRSKNDHANDSEPSQWLKLHGANYAAYQPSVSDIGYQLLCVIDFVEGGKTCQRLVSPRVTTEETLLQSAKSSLLKEVSGENRVQFSSLKDSSGNVYRLKIVVETNAESCSITNSTILLEQLVNGVFDPLHAEPLSICALGIRARSDPSRPRGFEIELPPTAELTGLKLSENRLVLEAPNRNTRESLLIALGIASYTGTLSSLSNNTILLPYSSNIDEAIMSSKDQHEESLSTDAEQESTTSKNLYTIQIEAQMKEMRSKVDEQAALISRLQQKIAVSNEDKKKTEKELMLARGKADELLRCEQEVRERDMLINDQERTIKSLNNEKAVLAASIEMRDGKLDVQSEQISELQRSLADALRQVEEAKKLAAEQAEARLKADKAKVEMETASVIADMKREESQFQEELKAARNIIEELNKKYASTKESASKSKDELDKIRSEAKRVKMERNTFKNKADSLSKEISKMKCVPVQPQVVNEAEIRTLNQTIKQLQLHNSQLQNELTTIRSEKRGIQDELQATRAAHEHSTRYITVQQPITPSRESQRANGQCEELERMISNLTEHLDAKEMQIDTLKQINEALMKELDDKRVAQKSTKVKE